MSARAHPERDLQIQVVRWLALNFAGDRDVEFVAINPLPPRTSPRIGGLMRAMGGFAGWPDLLVIRAGCSPLFIEIKAPKGRLSVAQHECHWRLQQAGARVVVIRSLDELAVALRDLGWPIRARRAA